jgi:hypothetical protein
MPKTFLNDTSFEHISGNGTKFKSTRCDFRDGCVVVKRKGIIQALFAQDIAEMAGYHALNIRPDLNGFSGYDTIHFEIRETAD